MRALLIAALAAVAWAAITVPRSCGVTPCPFGNNNCTDLACSRCDGPGGFNGMCVAGHACGSSCVSNGDCDQLGDCKWCEAGKCKAVCKANCTSSSDCAAPCGSCVEGTCQKWSCGETCTKSSDCAGACGTCVNSKCQSECGNECKTNSDCPFGCGTCKDGTCVAANTCQAACDNNLQCPQSQPCKYCIEHKCAAGCGQTCTADSQCYSGCDKCIGGKCTIWQCGNTCSNSSHCIGDCATCANGTCTSECGAACLTNSDCPSVCGTCTGGKCM